MIKLTNLQKIYRTKEIETVALENVNLEVQQGEFLSIMGPSGCGKSTLLNIMGLLDLPTSGTVEINGVNTVGMSDKELAAFRNKQLGFVFQSFHLINSLNVLDNVELPLLYRKVSSSERRKLAEAVLEKVGLSHRMRHFPTQLSGGQCQRVAIARALALEPEILILDEATSALDVSVQQTIIELIVKLQKEKNITIGFICHDISLIQSCAHEVAVMYLGNVVEVLPAKNLSERAVHPYTRALIGSIFDIGMDFGKPIEEIKGEAPSPLDVPAGCPFRGRCPKATEKCAAEKPKLHQIGADHEVACHLFDKEDK